MQKPLIVVEDDCPHWDGVPEVDDDCRHWTKQIALQMSAMASSDDDGGGTTSPQAAFAHQ